MRKLHVINKYEARRIRRIASVNYFCGEDGLHGWTNPVLNCGWEPVCWIDGGDKVVEPERAHRIRCKVCGYTCKIRQASNSVFHHEFGDTKAGGRCLEKRVAAHEAQEIVEVQAFGAGR